MIFGNRNRKISILGIVILALGLTVHSLSWAESTPSHMDRSKQPRGCSGCHGGRGSPGTPLLKGSLQDFCYTCHGNRNRRGADTNIEAVFGKASRHPVFETTEYHSREEALPEQSSTAPRHVSCYDCHRAHSATPENPMRGARGYMPGSIRGIQAEGPPPGIIMRTAEYEYQVCYLCHSDSANLPGGSRNIGAEFDPTNESFHPVEAVGKNSFVPSLVTQLSTTEKISCGSCHGNSDPGGPQGPHGSDYDSLLVAEYLTSDGLETAKAYELCYMCHDRSSILRDDSFKRHNLHVLQNDTSCFTCHASHGSRMDRHLISFNDAVVAPSANSGGPLYLPVAGGAPKCYLSCHGADHSSSGVGEKAWTW